jgi:hypothetical protein
MDLGLLGNILKVGGVREHGRRIKVGWEGGVSREDGTPELSRGVSKESTKVTSPLRDEKTFLVMEETTIGSFEVGIVWLRVGESMSKLTV